MVQDLRRRASPGAGPYVDEREWYFLEKDKEYVAKPRESHLERGREPRSVKVRRQMYDDHPTSSQRRISRERQSEAPRIPRRVTAYTEPWHDLGDGQLAGRSVAYGGTRMYDRGKRNTRRRDVYEEERRHGRHRDDGRPNVYDEPLLRRDSDTHLRSGTRDLKVVTSTGQTRGDHDVGRQQNEPGLTTPLEAVIAAQKIVRPKQDDQEHDPDHAELGYIPGRDSAGEINPIAQKKTSSFTKMIESGFQTPPKSPFFKHQWHRIRLVWAALPVFETRLRSLIGSSRSYSTLMACNKLIAPHYRILGLSQSDTVRASAV